MESGERPGPHPTPPRVAPHNASPAGAGAGAGAVPGGLHSELAEVKDQLSSAPLFAPEVEAALEVMQHRLMKKKDEALQTSFSSASGGGGGGGGTRDRRDPPPDTQRTVSPMRDTPKRSPFAAWQSTPTRKGNTTAPRSSRRGSPSPLRSDAFSPPTAQRGPPTGGPAERERGWDAYFSGRSRGASRVSEPPTPLPLPLPQARVGRPTAAPATPEGRGSSIGGIPFSNPRDVRVRDRGGSPGGGRDAELDPIALSERKLVAELRGIEGRLQQRRAEHLSSGGRHPAHLRRDRSASPSQHRCYAKGPVARLRSSSTTRGGGGGGGGGGTPQNISPRTRLHYGAASLSSTRSHHRGGDPPADMCYSASNPPSERGAAGAHQAAPPQACPPPEMPPLGVTPGTPPPPPPAASSLQPVEAEEGWGPHPDGVHIQQRQQAYREEKGQMSLPMPPGRPEGVNPWGNAMASSLPPPGGAGAAAPPSGGVRRTPAVTTPGSAPDVAHADPAPAPPTAASASAVRQSHPFPPPGMGTPQRGGAAAPKTPLEDAVSSAHCPSGDEVGPEIGYPMRAVAVLENTGPGSRARQRVEVMHQTSPLAAGDPRGGGVGGVGMGGPPPPPPQLQQGRSGSGASAYEGANVENVLQMLERSRAARHEAPIRGASQGDSSPQQQQQHPNPYYHNPHAGGPPSLPLPPGRMGETSPGGAHSPPAVGKLRVNADPRQRLASPSRGGGGAGAGAGGGGGGSVAPTESPSPLWRSMEEVISGTHGVSFGGVTGGSSSSGDEPSGMLAGSPVRITDLMNLQPASRGEPPLPPMPSMQEISESIRGETEAAATAPMPVYKPSIKPMAAQRATYNARAKWEHVSYSDSSTQRLMTLAEESKQATKVTDDRIHEYTETLARDVSETVPVPPLDQTEYDESPQYPPPPRNLAREKVDQTEVGDGPLGILEDIRQGLVRHNVSGESLLNVLRNIDEVVDQAEIEERTKPERRQLPVKSGSLRTLRRVRGGESKSELAWKDVWVEADERELRFYSLNARKDGRSHEKPLGRVQYSDTARVCDNLGSDGVFFYFGMERHHGGKVSLFTLCSPSAGGRRSWCVFFKRMMKASAQARLNQLPSAFPTDQPFESHGHGNPLMDSPTSSADGNGGGEYL